MVDGTPSVRTPDGARTLAPGDVVCFPQGAVGAHAVTGPGRILMLSNGTSPVISVYPDSEKVGTRPAERSDNLNFRRGDAVDYWDGEQ